MKTTMRLIDRNLLQAMQNAFSESIRTTVFFVDPHGNRVTASSYPGTAGGGTDSGGGALPEILPGAVSVLTAEACLGQWILGDTAPEAAPLPVHAQVFMPVENNHGILGFLGFDPETLGDWPPEMLAHFWNLSRVLADTLGSKPGRKRARAFRFGSVGKCPKSQPRSTV